MAVTCLDQCLSPQARQRMRVRTVGARWQVARQRAQARVAAYDLVKGHRPMIGSLRNGSSRTGETNIRVNAIAPGAVGGERIERFSRRGRARRRTAALPARRYLAAHEQQLVSAVDVWRTFVSAPRHPTTARLIAFITLGNRARRCCPFCRWLPGKPGASCRVQPGLGHRYRGSCCRQLLPARSSNE
jgi:hypothetical protein